MSIMGQLAALDGYDPNATFDPVPKELPVGSRYMVTKSGYGEQPREAMRLYGGLPDFDPDKPPPEMTAAPPPQSALDKFFDYGSAPARAIANTVNEIVKPPSPVGSPLDPYMSQVTERSNYNNAIANAQQTAWGGNAATNLAGIAMPFAAKGGIGIFGGRGAQTADAEKFAIAQKMEQAGADASDIRRSTGWFQGADKQWRFEIPDTNARYLGVPPQLNQTEIAKDIFARDNPMSRLNYNTPPYMKQTLAANAAAAEQMKTLTARLPDVLEHPALYEAYPQLRDVEVMLSHPQDRTLGAYQSGGAEGNPMISFRPPQNVDPRGKTLDTLLHESTHGVQEIEDFARGGNPAFLRPGTPAWDIYKERLKAMATPETRAEYSARMGYGDRLAPDNEYNAYLKRNKKEANSPSMQRYAQDYAAREGYRRSAGEVEANVPGVRKDLTASQRFERDPWLDETVPRADQLVEFRDRRLLSDPQASVVKPVITKNDPNLFENALSSIKQRIPLSVLDQGRRFRPDVSGNLFSRPEDLQQGGTILSLHGDRSNLGWLEMMLGNKVDKGEHYVPGGVGFIGRRSPEGSVWASEPMIASGYQNKIDYWQNKTGKPVYGAYGPMGVQSIDFQPAPSKLALEQVRRNRGSIDNSAIETFDKDMSRQWGGPTLEKPDKKPDWPAVEGWPGITSEHAEQFLADATGKTRDKFMKMLDRAEMMDKGMPNASAIRHAFSNPDVANLPNYSYGKGIAQLSPEAATTGYQHPAFGKNIAGENLGGWGYGAPREVVFPDVVRGLQKHKYPTSQWDFFFGGRMPKVVPYAQRVTPKWLDMNSAYRDQVGQMGETAALDKFVREGLQY